MRTDKDEKFRKVEAHSKMSLEHFIVTQAQVSIRYLRSMEIFKDKRYKCQIWKTIEENHINERSRIVIFLNGRKKNIHTR